ncbi:MAG: AAA family ATPase [Melioribacteraceae bacterium]|nr:AAA family ATPase [Melioribacteraceae bacterium]
MLEEIHVSEVLLHIIQTYLFRLYYGVINNSELKVKNIYAVCNSRGNIIYPEMHDYGFTEKSDFLFDIYNFIIDYNGIEYIVTTRAYQIDTNTTEHINYRYEVMVSSSVQTDYIKIFNEISSFAKSNSFLLNNVVLLKDTGRADRLLESIEIVEHKKTSLDEIFIPANKKDQVLRFISAIKNFGRDRINLRYLLNGKPGTAKTQLINAIMNELSGQTTFVILENKSLIFSEVIEFCNVFPSCVLVIDDFDLLAETRQYNRNRDNLHSILTYLDGFQSNKIFLLATTNDKKLVDIAASRPGRFDLILDIDEIDKNNYMDLIFRETDDEEILYCFDNDFLNSLIQKKLTGAFIVSFIKQLKSLKLFKGGINKDDAYEQLEMIYGGFYKSNSEYQLKSLGFSNELKNS